ncbi:unnamed protein product, partial [Brassica oleracea]
MAKCVRALRVLTVHYHSSLLRIFSMFSPSRSLSISTLKAVPSTTRVKSYSGNLSA